MLLRASSSSSLAYTELNPLSLFYIFRLTELLNYVYKSGNKEIPGHTSTALHHAVERILFPIDSLLVENRADVNAVFNFREKHFHRAVSLGYEDIAPF